MKIAVIILASIVAIVLLYKFALWFLDWLMNNLWGSK